MKQNKRDFKIGIGLGIVFGLINGLALREIINIIIGLF